MYLLYLFFLTANERALVNTLTPARSSSDSFAEKERKARTEQGQFCRDLDAGIIQAPLSGDGKLEHLKSKLATLQLGFPGKNVHFKMEVYDNNDIVSLSILGGNGWDNDKINQILDVIVNYADQHKVPLSDLTFVDIGANVGWFTFVMASLGLNVVSFEPLNQNLYLLRKTLCHPANTPIRDRVLLFGHGLSYEKQTCIQASGTINVGDGVMLCVQDPSTYVPPQGFEVRGSVAVDRIDDVLSTSDRHIVAVKMDTEGYEAHVVLGGPKFFLGSKIPYIFSEFVPSGMMAAAGGDGVRFVRNFLDAGYLLSEEGSTQYHNRKYALNLLNFPGVHELFFEYKPELATQ
jgi:FkbM family methyltransferase